MWITTAIPPSPVVSSQCHLLSSFEFRVARQSLAVLGLSTDATGWLVVLDFSFPYEAQLVLLHDLLSHEAYAEYGGCSLPSMHPLWRYILLL
jgi:hypothetical protein